MGRRSIAVEVQHWTDRVSDHVAATLPHSFEQVLFELIESVDKSIGDISVVCRDDIAQIWDWNRVLPELIPSCVHSLVEEQVRAKPDSQAICSFDQDFTYRELNSAAQKLANRLIDLDVGPGVLVPLCFDKSSWAIVAMYAVLKAGKSVQLCMSLL